MASDIPPDPRAEALAQARAELERALDDAIAKRHASDEDGERLRREEKREQVRETEDGPHRAGTAVLGGDMLPRRRVIVPRKDEYVLAERLKLHEINRARRNVLGATAAGALAAAVSAAPVALVTIYNLLCRNPFDGVDLWTLAVFFISLGVGGVSIIFWAIKERTEGETIKEMLDGEIFDYDEINKRLIPVEKIQAE